MDFLPESFFKEYIKKKEKIGISARGILPDTERDRSYNELTYKSIKPNIIPVLRYIPHEMFPFKGEITIYGENKVSIAKLGDKNLIGVIIEDEVIHGMMKMIFDLGWQSAKD